MIQLFQQKNGTDAWFPVYTDFERRAVRFVFETAGGIVFIGSNNRLFKSGNKGKSWKLLPTGGLVMKMVESNGTLLATGTAGILRSSDEGETWNWVIKDGGVGIDVASFNGGFAAISFSTLSNTRRIRASYDAGITWQAIDAGLPQESSIAPPAKALFQINRNDSAWHPMDSGLPSNAFISSIVKAGEQFFCGHPAGIFTSSDKGKTWKLLLPSVKGKIFHLSVVGNVIYAIPANAGC